MRLSRENLVAPVPEVPAAPVVAGEEQKELVRVRAMAANSPDRLFSDGGNTLVEAMVAGGADWTTRGSDGSTALHAAAAAGRSRWVEAAIQAGVDPNSPTEDAVTPLMAAQRKSLGYRSVPAL